MLNWLLTEGQKNWEIKTKLRGIPTTAEKSQKAKPLKNRKKNKKYTTTVGSLGVSGG